jgi:hypothetical protein
MCLISTTGCGSKHATTQASSAANPSIPAVGPTEGGYTLQTSPKGYTATLNIGVPADQITTTTQNGYSIELNLQGQLSQ